MNEGKQIAGMFRSRIPIDVQMGYLVYLPDGYGRDQKVWPLVLFLHGAGERGTALDLVKKHGPPRLADNGKKFPFILVSPQCPEDENWSVPALKALLDRIGEMYRVDQSRVYLTGMSMGGNGIWRLATAFPRHFAAIAPVCGWGNPDSVGVLKDTPVWVFHGKKDSVIPFEKSEVMVRALESAGGIVRFTAYPEAGHDAWTATYDDPAFYEWLTGQTRDRR